MSLCVIVRSNEHLWVGADTALSTTIKGISYRIHGESREKVFLFKDNIIFCSGLTYVSDLVKEKILEMETLDINAVQSYVRDLVKSLPKEYENHETGIIICKFNGEVFSMVQEKDFAIIEQEPSSPEVIAQLFTGGFKCEEANKIATEAIYSEKDSIINVFGKVYSDLSSEIIGDRLVLYHIDILNKTTEKYMFEIKEPNKERYHYCYYDEVESDNKTAFFRGTVQAKDFLFESGGSIKTILNEDKQRIGADFLDLTGLNINNRFMIDSMGNVTINGGSISWNALPSNVASIGDIPALPSYIKSTYIDATKLLSPIIGAGAFYGAKYWNLTNTPSATVNPTGDMYMEMYGIGNTKGWHVVNEAGGGWKGTVLDAYVSSAYAMLSLGGQLFLQYDPVTSFNKVWPMGSWDFANATIYNLNVSAKWA